MTACLVGKGTHTVTHVCKGEKTCFLVLSCPHYSVWDGQVKGPL